MSKQVETSKEPIKDTPTNKEPITDDTQIFDRVSYLQYGPANSPSSSLSNDSDSGEDWVHIKIDNMIQEDDYKLP